MHVYDTWARTLQQGGADFIFCPRAQNTPLDLTTLNGFRQHCPSAMTVLVLDGSPLYAAFFCLLVLASAASTIDHLGRAAITDREVWTYEFEKEILEAPQIDITRR